MGIFPYWPRFDNFPTLILVKIMPLSHFSCYDRSWSGLFNLIKDAYLHDDQHNIYRMPRYTIGEKLNPKHNITDQWWGLGL